MGSHNQELVGFWRTESNEIFHTKSLEVGMAHNKPEHLLADSRCSNYHGSSKA